MGMMERANIVSPSADAEPADTGSTDAGQTLLVNAKGSGGKLAVTVIGILLVAAAAIFVAYRLFGGGSVAADASRVETKAERPAVSASDAPVSVCQGDLSQASEQRQWYCNGFMPWKQAVDARLAERSGAGTPTAVWILIGLLSANGVALWIMVLRRRKPSL